MSDVWGRQHNWGDLRYEASRGNKKARAEFCASWKGLKDITRNTVAIAPLSLNNLLADKARFGQLFTAPWGAPDILGQDAPRLKAKGEYVLAQLAEKTNFGNIAFLALEASYYPVNFDPSVPASNIVGQYSDKELTKPPVDCS